MLRIKVMKMNNYPKLLSPKRVGNILFKNRIFTAPTGVHALQHGELSFQEPVLTHFGNRARGGAAMVTCTGVQINPNIQSDGSHLHINPYTTEGLRSLYELAARVHHFGAVASMQLSDQYRYDRYYAVSPGLKKLGRDSVEMPKEMIAQKAKMFADAAEIVKKAGFDMCMLHFGHATDNAQFLSERFNKRTDEFGGSLENRARYLTMTLDAIRERCGKNFLIELRFSASEVDPEGITVEDSIQLVKLLEGKVDLLHCSCGMNTARYFTTTHPSGFLPDTPNVQYAEAIKKSGTSIPVVAIGAIQNLEQAEEIIASGKADFVSIARGVIADPELANKAYDGKPEDVRPCIKCFKCHDGACYYDHFVCSVNPTIGIEDKLDRYILPTGGGKKICVVGGGPAGMQAAVYLADRGHRVTLFESRDHLGGQLNFADYAEFKRDLGRFKKYLITQVEKRDIRVRLNTKATPELLAAENPDHVILALGAEPLVIPIPGVENTVKAPEVFGNEDKLGQKLVMIGGGQVGAETGIHLARLGKDVTILEMQSKIAPDAWFTYKWAMDIELNERENLKTIVNGRCSKIEEGKVTYIDPEGKEQILQADSVVLCVGFKSNTQAAESLILPGVPFTMIGDCKAVGTVQQAVRSAFDVAMTL